MKKETNRFISIMTMGRKALLAILLCFAWLQGLSAQDIKPNLSWGKPTEQELQMTEYPADKDADAVVLCHNTTVYYVYQDDGFKLMYEVKNRLKVLKSEGNRVADGKIVLIDSETSRGTRESVNGLKATAYNMENGKVVKTKMEKSMINEERLDKNQKVVKFSVPQVKVGTVIEYEYTITSDYFYYIRDWNAQQDIPVLYAKYHTTIPKWFVFNFEERGKTTFEKKTENGSTTAILRGASEQIDATVRTFTGRNLPALKGDDYVWCPQDYGSKIIAELSAIYIPGEVRKTYTSTWNDIDEQLIGDNDFGGRLKKGSPLKEEIAASGIPAIADKKERAAAVWKLLKSKVRWNGEYSLWGKSAEKVLKEGTGDNADINFIYINMLKDAGLDAWPIVMSTRTHGMLPLSHASIKYLNTFVVGIVTDDEGLTYFDSSAEDGYLDVLPANLLVSRARLITKEKNDTWINLQEKARGRENTTIDVTLDESGKLKGVQERLLLEESAAALRRSWRQAKDSVEMINTMQEKKGIEIESYQLEKRNEFSPDVKETIHFSKQCNVAGETIYMNPFIIPQLPKSPFTSEERLLPVEFPYKQRDVVNVNITLPEGYVVEDLPKSAVLKLDGITARITYVNEGNTLKMQYQLNVTKTLFALEEYNDLKEFFDKLAESNNVTITIKKA